MANIITDMETWLLDYGDRVYRFLVYKKMFTPYETQKSFSDESIYEDIHYRFAVIDEAIDLGNGEWLFGLKEIIDCEFTKRIVYYKLSEIYLEYCEKDQDMFNENYENNE